MDEDGNFKSLSRALQYGYQIYRRTSTEFLIRKLTYDRGWVYSSVNA
jgi:hypothetical protein